jgi:hypothetical protein
MRRWEVDIGWHTDVFNAHPALGISRHTCDSLVHEFGRSISRQFSCRPLVFTCEVRHETQDPGLGSVGRVIEYILPAVPARVVGDAVRL